MALTSIKNCSKYIINFCLILVSAMACLTACSPNSNMHESPRTGVERGWRQGSFLHDELQREFRYFIPEDISNKVPVVILLHGGWGNMNKIFQNKAGGTQEWAQIADQENFILLVPNGTNAETGATEGEHLNWNDCRQGSGNRISTADDVGFIKELLDWTGRHFAEEEITIDKDRIYVTGASNGGMMSYRLITALPDRFAAAAVFIANRPANSECPNATVPTPLLIVNGTKDPLMPYEGGNIPFDGGRVRSAEVTRDYWISVNHAGKSDRTITKLPDRDTRDGSHIICEFYPSSGKDGAPVRYCKVVGGGHSMPSIDHQLSRLAERIVGPQNHDIEGARFAWEFLEQYSN